MFVIEKRVQECKLRSTVYIQNIFSLPVILLHSRDFYSLSAIFFYISVNTSQHREDYDNNFFSTPSLVEMSPDHSPWQQIIFGEP